MGAVIICAARDMWYNHRHLINQHVGCGNLPKKLLYVGLCVMLKTMVFGKVLRSVHPLRHFAEISPDCSILPHVIFALAWYRELDAKTGAI